MPLHVAEGHRNVPVYVVFPTTRQEGPEGEQRYNSPLSLTSALDWGGWSTLAPTALTPRKTGGWVDPMAGVDGYGKSRPIGIRPPDRPDRSKSLYWLRYPASNHVYERIYLKKKGICG